MLPTSKTTIPARVNKTIFYQVTIWVLGTCAGNRATNIYPIFFGLPRVRETNAHIVHSTKNMGGARGHTRYYWDIWESQFRWKVNLAFGAETRH